VTLELYVLFTSTREVCLLLGTYSSLPTERITGKWQELRQNFRSVALNMYFYYIYDFVEITNLCGDFERNMNFMFVECLFVSF
jgi:hypothetical protein